jgi:hypothetical protein
VLIREGEMRVSTILAWSVWVVLDHGLVAMTVSAHQQPANLSIVRVRGEDPEIGTILRDAVDRSPAFRRLVETINATNGIVFIEHGQCRARLKACLLISVTMAGSERLLHIHVDTRGDIGEVTGLIGHELQHASEALSEAGVTSGALLFAYFERIAGSPTASGQLEFETEAATRAGETVRREIESFWSARHVRATDGKLRRLIGLGETRSVTFRRLLLRLDSSDVVVSLDAKQTSAGSPGFLIKHVTTAGLFRYIRVNVETRSADDQVISIVAHELEHATEVAEASDVRDDVALLRLFQRAAVGRGCDAGRECYETRAAREVQQVVRAELRGAAICAPGCLGNVARELTAPERSPRAVGFQHAVDR